MALNVLNAFLQGFQPLLDFGAFKEFVITQLLDHHGRRLLGPETHDGIGQQSQVGVRAHQAVEPAGGLADRLEIAEAVHIDAHVALVLLGNQVLGDGPVLQLVVIIKRTKNDDSTTSILD